MPVQEPDRAEGPKVGRRLEEPRARQTRVQRAQGEEPERVMTPTGWETSSAPVCPPCRPVSKNVKRVHATGHGRGWDEE